jgi:hypothetical protein
MVYYFFGIYLSLYDIKKQILLVTKIYRQNKSNKYEIDIF